MSAVEITVAVHVLIPTDDEDARNLTPYLGEVRIDGTPVYGERVHVHVSAPPATAASYIHNTAVAGFAERLRGMMGYHPEIARGDTRG